MTRCTYVECGEDATHPQVAKDGSTWADLCATHDAKVNAAIEAGDARKILGEWVRAQGGAKAAAARVPK